MNAERLLRLAEHPIFDMGYVNHGLLLHTVKGIPNVRDCGCAIGETPLLWPEFVQFGNQRADILVCSPSAVPRFYVTVAQNLFDIGREDARHLFSNQPLTAPEIASRIRQFVAEREVSHQT